MIENNTMKTSLFDSHKSLNAKLLPFADYLMPISYPKGLQHEYDAVRNKVGMFDVSHMGQIYVEGLDAAKFLQFATVNNIEKMNIGSAQYNLICNEDGCIIDDVIIYMITKQKFLLVVNASNILKNYEWLKNKLENFKVNIENHSNQYSLIAVQGPKSRENIAAILNYEINLDFYTFKINKSDILISRTGYTGELGYEIIANHETIVKVWKLLLKNNVVPCGLAVRDILRMEMKYCLYGNDISINNNPIEAGLDWVIDFSKDSYIGKSKIDEIKKNGPNKRLVCFIIKDKAIPRAGYKIISDKTVVGKVTSGTFSLGLKKGIGLAYIDSKYLKNYTVFIDIRNKLYEINIIKPPFIKNTSLHN